MEKSLEQKRKVSQTNKGKKNKQPVIALSLVGYLKIVHNLKCGVANFRDAGF